MGSLSAADETLRRRAALGLLVWIGGVLVFVLLIILDAPPEKLVLRNLVPSLGLNAGLIALGVYSRRRVVAGSYGLALGLLVAYGIMALVALAGAVGAGFNGGFLTILGFLALFGSYSFALLGVWRVRSHSRAQQ